MPRIARGYYNWLDVFADVKREGVEAWRERNVPVKQSYGEVPEGWMTCKDVADWYGLDDTDAHIVVSRAKNASNNGGREFLQGKKVVSAAPAEFVKRVAADMKANPTPMYVVADGDTRISIREAAQWSTIHRRQLDYYVKALGVRTDLMHMPRSKVRIRLVEPVEVVRIAKHIVNGRKHGRKDCRKRVNCFVRKVSKPDFDISKVREEIRKCK